MRLSRMTTGAAMIAAYLWCTAAPDTNPDIRLEIVRPTIPVLACKDFSSTIRLNFIRQTPAPYAIEKLVVNFNGSTDLSDIRTASVFGLSGKDSRLDVKKPVYAPLTIPTDGIVEFSGTRPVDCDTFSVWVAVTLRDTVPLDHKIHVTLEKVATTTGILAYDNGTVKPLRVGVSVRRGMQDNVHTSRIPAITTLTDGSLIAAFDARRQSPRDLQGDMDIAIHRSFDGGTTWQPMQTVLDMGTYGGLPEKFNGVSDPGILQDPATGHIFITGLWMHGVIHKHTGKWIEGLTNDSTSWNHQWAHNGSHPGLGLKETSQFLITESHDNGQTWSEPRNLTAELKNPEWCLISPTSGHGIVLKDGTLVFPTQGRDSAGVPFSNITWSKDHGKTWHTSAPAYYDPTLPGSNTTECTVAELNNGLVMLNMRDNRNKTATEPNSLNGRRICVTADLGKTWTEHATSRTTLNEPVCSAALHRHGDILLFSNPDSRTQRTHMTLKASRDDGMTWPKEHQVLYDEYRSAGYSSVTSVDNETIGVLYESSQTHLAFIWIKLSELYPDK